MVCYMVAAAAQPNGITLTGKIADIKNNDIAGATLRLIAVKDSLLVKHAVTNADGTFNIVGLRQGKYLLAITALGMIQKQMLPVTIDGEKKTVALPLIILQPAGENNLATVVVKAKRPLLEQEIDKTVVNVDAMISSATSNTLEVLQNTPGVTVNSNGDISLNGRGGVLVLIDGRSTYMSAQDLAAYLKSLPGAILDKIELMDNPPARYDAAGNAIINIKLKKNRAGGFTGGLSAGYTQGRYARHNDAVNLNYNYKKINLFANVGYNNEKNYTADDYNRMFYDAANNITSSMHLLNNQLYSTNGININTGIDYAATGNTTLGLTANINSGTRDGMFVSAGNYYNKLQQLDTLSNGHTTSHDTRSNTGIGLTMVHKFAKTGRELSADVNYLHYRDNGRQVFLNTVTTPGGSPLADEPLLYLTPAAINIYTAKADYTHTLPGKAKLEAGIKTSIVDNDNQATYNTQLNHFLYKENINAAYINAQKSWDRWGVKLGLRAENTQSTGRQLDNDVTPASRFTKNYTQLFPSMFVQYKFDSVGRNSLTFSITKRINRPNYQLLNPFIFVKDKYSYTEGNPKLIPQYQYRYELRYQYKQFVRMGLSYNHFTNTIFQTTQTVNNVFITHPENLGTGYMLLLNTGINLPLKKWWRLNMDILLSHMGLNGMSDGVVVSRSTYVARINVFNQMQFNKGWSAEWGAYYASNDLNGQTFTGGMFRANFSAQKKFWKDKASIRLSMDDIFHSWVYHLHSFDLRQASYFQTSETDTQRFGLAFTYRFGNELFARKAKHVNNASDEEKSRVQ